MKREILVYSGIIAFLLIIALIAFYMQPESIENFEDCVAAGNPVMESYPRQCRDQISGDLFVEEVEDFWRFDQIDLRQHETEKYYGCFGCGATICIDPIPEMKAVNETEDRYCNSEFEVIES